MSDLLTITIFDYLTTTEHGSPRIVASNNRQAYRSILDGLENRRNDLDLAEALVLYPALCELAASVAVIRGLDRELADRDATDADHAVLNNLRMSQNPWVRGSAGRLLVQIADGAA